MKKTIGLILTFAMLTGLFAGCGKTSEVNEQAPENHQESAYTGVRIRLSDSGITVDEPQSEDGKSAVKVGGDIVYYEAGKDFTYGEGTQKDAHSAKEAAAHTLITITKPGQYILSGKLTKGQIAVDLGEDAEEDPNAVVTLVLENADITCSVAPAVIFYNVYECGSADADDASATVDTADAGANVIIADGTVNNISGAYVAKIYKPESVELSEDGTEVLDAKKLHKYDAAFYSKMSMNISGGPENSGVLNIEATNEGLDSELHLTINGGNINIISGNDGINTNEDEVSVTTINGGRLNILVNGATGEGDGIDSNGYLVINGGTVIAQACAFSADAGIDSDMGIHINGGTVVAIGNMLDRIGESEQNFAVFQFAERQKGDTYTLKDSAGQVVAQQEIENDFQYLMISSADLTPGQYSLWKGDTQLQGAAGGQMGGFMGPGGQKPDGMGRPEDMQPPEGMEDMAPPEAPEGEPPQDGQFPGGMGRPGDRGQQGEPGEVTGNFPIQAGGNYFQGVA